MLSKEKLLELGISAELADKVVAELKTAMTDYIPKHRFDEVNTELKTEREKVVDRDKQINNLKKFEGDAKAFQEQIDKLENDNKVKDAQYQATLTLERKKSAIRTQLLQDAAKPHDADMVLGLFDLDTVEVDETGKIVKGFKEQHDNMKKDKAFLFAKVETPAPNTNKGWTPLGSAPPDGSNEPPADESISFGKSLAKAKLGIMGIDTEKK